MKKETMWKRYTKQSKRIILLIISIEVDPERYRHAKNG